MRGRELGDRLGERALVGVRQYEVGNIAARMDQSDGASAAGPPTLSVVLHVGLMKSGTTFVQTLLFENSRRWPSGRAGARRSRWSTSGLPFRTSSVPAAARVKNDGTVSTASDGSSRRPTARRGLDGGPDRAREALTGPAMPRSMWWSRLVIWSRSSPATWQETLKLGSRRQPCRLHFGSGSRQGSGGAAGSSLPCGPARVEVVCTVRDLNRNRAACVAAIQNGRWWSWADYLAGAERARHELESARQLGCRHEVAGRCRCR